MSQAEPLLPTTGEPRHPNIGLYCWLMEQVKWRIDAVLKTVEMVGTGQHYLANLPAAEFCLLQLRMVCELIALGCIAIHTDVPQTARLQKLWNAGAIIEELKKLKPTYFPIPAKNVVDENGAVYFNVRLDDPGLSPSELLKMYNFFGSLLHAGTFKSRSNPTQKSYDFDIVVDFVEKLRKLLSTHMYLLDDSDRIVRVIMNNAEDNGRVGARVFRRLQKG